MRKSQLQKNQEKEKKEQESQLVKGRVSNHNRFLSENLALLEKKGDQIDLIGNMTFQQNGLQTEQKQKTNQQYFISN